MIVFSRLIRRLFVIVIFLAILSLGWWLYQKNNITAPTCTDGIKNGQEEGVDCGVLACGIDCLLELGSPRVISKKLIPAGTQDYDFVAEVKNQHTDFGASEVAYELTLFNGNGQQLLNREGVFYILPGQTKFLVLPFLTAERNVSDIDFKIKSSVWQKVSSMEGVNLSVVRQSYTVLEGGKSSALEAVVLNDSDFDFDTVDIDVILRDQNGLVVAVNKSEINTLLAHTERGFRVVWPFPIVENVSEVDIMPSTNLFDNYNFIKRYGSGFEQFQQY